MFQEASKALWSRGLIKHLTLKKRLLKASQAGKKLIPRSKPTKQANPIKSINHQQRPVKSYHWHVVAISISLMGGRSKPAINGFQGRGLPKKTFLLTFVWPSKTSQSNKKQANFV
jgi:hypothetical protein